MTDRLSRLAPAGVLLLAAVAATPTHRAGADDAAKPQGAVSAERKLEYNRDVRPILAENCFACHGPDSAARKADLRIDRREDAIAAGAIVPGDPAKSTLIERICAAEPTEIMPPPRTNKKITAAQKELLKKWVAQGAEYQPHWSFIAPTRPTVPTFAGDAQATAWVRNPVDAFVLYRLKQEGLAPAPEADRRTLARRLSLDLTGLPPGPDEVEAFVNDRSPDYYEKYVDALMASPHWGEHRGRFWLDYARYADTHGIHFDNMREMWSYRDWVIGAFNRNVPFDQFTTEQLAGDLLPNPTMDQRVATGFNRCNITTNEGGIIDEEYVVLYARDRTETTSQVWMGLTTGCAVCHDHKYDPITMRDFYSLSAFFNHTTQPTRDGNIPNTPPIIAVPRMEDRPRFEALSKELADARAAFDGRRAAAKPAFDAWLKTAKPEQIVGTIPTEKMSFHAKLNEGAGSRVYATSNGQLKWAGPQEGFDWSLKQDKAPRFTVKAGGAPDFGNVGDFDRTTPYTVSAWISISKRGTGGPVFGKMDTASDFRGWDVWLEQDKVATHLINAWPDNALKVSSRTPFQPGKWYHVCASYDGSGSAAGMRLFIDGEPQPVDVQADTLKATTKNSVPFVLGQRSTGPRTAGVGVYDVRLYDRGLTGGEVLQLAKAERAAELLKNSKRTPQETDELFGWWLVTTDGPYKQMQARVSALQAEETAIRSRGTIAHVMQEKPGEAGAFMLFRGEYDKRRDPVKAETPKSMPPMAAELPRNRLGLAKWLLSKEHPLTARVTVNRFWQELFGTGLVKTSGDFGVSGELPSHPELLDWLAVEFREPTVASPGRQPGGAWDVKRFFKLLVSSSTYRQAAVLTKEKVERDRDNRLLSRGPRYRMEGEMIRDHALAASGLLVRKIGGPSVRPYQPEGVWEAVAMIGSNTRDYRRDSGENLYRRSMYTFWKRSAPPASMEIFNAPSREGCTVRRERTNTPIQALVTLNDVQFVEAARVLAEKGLKASEKDDGRIDYIVRRLIARPLRAEELAIVKGSLADLRAHFRENPAEAKKLIAFGESKADPALDPSELAAWTMLVNQLMNLDEVLNK
jgi:hypothetical protein